jgi:hypothetical protein
LKKTEYYGFLWVYKNVISNNLVPAEEDQGEPMVAMKLSEDDNQSFNWIAFQ